ncbi:MAG TPA: hypothetical protein VME45_19015 [Stellaceae bacterium]|nr:hypothetical protein [Stellaceae bacterium]
MECIAVDQVRKLRHLAAQYRILAAGAENNSVREERLRTAALLEREAAYTECAFISPPARLRSWGVRPLS